MMLVIRCQKYRRSGTILGPIDLRRQTPLLKRIVADLNPTFETNGSLIREVLEVLDKADPLRRLVMYRRCLLYHPIIIPPVYNPTAVPSIWADNTDTHLRLTPLKANNLLGRHPQIARPLNLIFQTKAHHRAGTDILTANAPKGLHLYRGRHVHQSIRNIVEHPPRPNGRTIQMRFLPTLPRSV